VRLKSQLHAIIGVCAAAVFVVTGVIAWFEVRRVHRLEVKAQGETMGLFLAKACALAMRDRAPREALEAVLTSGGGEQEPPVASAVVFDAREKQVIARVGSTSREVEVSELEPGLTIPSGRVLVEEGEEVDRLGPAGEDLVEFTVPIDAGSERIGVLHLSLRATQPSVLGTSLTIVLGSATMVAALWFLLYKMLDGRILKPIVSLMQGITRVRSGDLTARVEVERRDELGMLAESFNELIGILIERDSLQQRLEEANRLTEAHRRLNDAHRQLKEAQEQLILNEKHASLGRLVHGLNHELNNPLSAAKNMVPPLEAAIACLRDSLQPASEVATPPERVGSADERTSAEIDLRPPAAPAKPAVDVDEVSESLADASEAASVIARSVQRAINIVRDLGQFSKLGTADLEEVELSSIIGEAVTACAPELGPDGRVTVTVDAGPTDGKAIKLKAFPNLLTQVFVNLITNSAQAIEGTGKVKITARLLPATDRVRIEVEDTGPGIAKEHLPKVFEPFFTTKEPGRGTGLGLAICLGVIEKHGGTIEALKRRRGACFVIELPREAQVKPQDPRQSASLFSGSTITLAPSR
jgi:signal transduction histidine kinase